MAKNEEPAVISYPSISVIVPVGNMAPSFPHCLARLRQCVAPPNEVIVVLDGGVWPRYALEDSHVTALRFPQPVGPAAARNAGAAVACSNFLLFVDADVLVPVDVIDCVKKLILEYPECHAFVGSYDSSPRCASFISQYRNLLHHYVHQQSATEASTFWGGCGVISRELFNNIGGFNEKYNRPCVEDIELGYRLRLRGAVILMCRTLQVKHLKEWKALGVVSSDIFDRAIPWTVLILEYRSKISTSHLNVDTRARLSLLLLGVATWTALASLRWTTLLPAVVLCLLSVLALNGSLYKFFREVRGIRFALKVIPWHFVHLICCGVGLIFGALVFVSDAILGKRLAVRDPSQNVE